VAVLQSRGFSADDFARTHPGGVLGKRLLLYVSDIMHSGQEIPLVKHSASFKDILLEMTGKSLGMTGVVDEHQRLIGIFTDGDLRRIMARTFDPEATRAIDVMSKNPYTVGPNTLAAEVVKTMREHAIHGPHAINAVFITDEDNTVIGALNTHDLLRAGVV
jgi:arabinose-5-phosphate isomerase